MANNRHHKIFNDSVHGTIEMHPLLVKIIDTPEFQRLRNIKQLGGGYFVYPGASHNRFEHSIGVAHLAGKLVKRLKDKQEDLKITDEDVLCVQIAGLCHDLGHGPFSHLFEKFMKRKEKEWKHEDQSIKMFEQICEEKVKEELKEAGLADKVGFIAALIRPPSEDQIPKDKLFLYEIVANPRTGIDVDKMDYFARDCHHLGMQSGFSHERYINFVRVCTDEEGRRTICMRDKEAMNMYELFHIRSLLHHNAYQHRVVKAVELMIIDALEAADETLKISARRTGVSLPGEQKDDSFLKLTDQILQEILTSPEEGLTNAKNIVKSIYQRDLYRFIGGKMFKPEKVRDLKKSQKEKLKKWLDLVQKETKLELKAEDFEVEVININYGMKNKNPIDALQFYTKEEPDKAIKLSKDEVSYLLPEVFSETKVMVFYKTKENETQLKEQIDLFWSLI